MAQPNSTGHHKGPLAGHGPCYPPTVQRAVGGKWRFTRQPSSGPLAGETVVLLRRNRCPIIANYGVGRVYAQNSLGAINLRKEIRGTLFIDSYVDIDVVNCHPAIIFQIAKSLDITCPSLENYINNREGILEEVQQFYSIDRNSAKKLFIILLYGGGFKNWAKENSIQKEELDIIKELRKELLCLRSKIVEMNPLIHSEIQKENKKDKTPYEITNRTVSHYIQAIETGY